MQSNFSTLCRGHIIPKELDRETAEKFMELRNSSPAS